MIPGGMLFNHPFAQLDRVLVQNCYGSKNLFGTKGIDFKGFCSDLLARKGRMIQVPRNYLLTSVPTGMYDFHKCRFRPLQGVPNSHLLVNDY